MLIWLKNQGKVRYRTFQLRLQASVAGLDELIPFLRAAYEQQMGMASGPESAAPLVLPRQSRCAICGDQTDETSSFGPAQVCGRCLQDKRASGADARERAPEAEEVLTVESEAASRVPWAADAS